MDDGTAGDSGARTSTGRCHRCGWSGTVVHLRRKERRALGLDRSVAYLCPECLTDLRAGPASSDGA